MARSPSSLIERTVTDPRLNLLISPQARLEQKYAALGGAAHFGPVDHKDPTAWYFKNGSAIVDNADDMAAFEIHGAIFQKWKQLGGIAFGIPTTDETGTPDGVGRFNHFNNNTASIYWTPDTGAQAIYGAIRQKWASLGWERSNLGYPTTDETATPDGVGRFNHFNNNTASIYWTPDTGAQAIYGAIREKWASLGWERSYLGFPTSDEVDFPEGGRANGFQNGGIYWWPDLGATDLRGVILHYTGLHCFGETDWDQGSNSDEPYFILSISTPKVAATLTTQTYEDVDGGETRPDLLELYRGHPYGINISAVLMEHDFGDQNKYRQEVQDAVMAVHTAGTIALGLIPVVGPFVAAVAGPTLGALMPSIGEAINDLFDEGDDRIGGANLTLSARQMVVLATRTNNTDFDGIGYKAETDLISGSGASYKGYFGIIPA
jgi:hypothetical protein